MVIFAMIFGDGYTEELMDPLVHYLKVHEIKTIAVPLLEKGEDVSYSEITSDNYYKYIDKYVPRFTNSLYLYGISKGYKWLSIYASRKNAKKLILVVPTTFPNKPGFLVVFEKDRGNLELKITIRLKVLIND